MYLLFVEGSPRFLLGEILWSLEILFDARGQRAIEEKINAESKIIVLT